MEDILRVNTEQGLPPQRQPGPDTLYTLQVSQVLGPDSVPVLEDIMRMVCIQVMIQGMFAMSHPSLSFATPEFAAMLLYIILGVAFYWLVLRRLVRFQ